MSAELTLVVVDNFDGNISTKTHEYSNMETCQTISKHFASGSNLGLNNSIVSSNCEVVPDHMPLEYYVSFASAFIIGCVFSYVFIHKIDKIISKIGTYV